MNLVELVCILLVTSILAGLGISAGVGVTNKARELEKDQREFEQYIEQMLGGENKCQSHIDISEVIYDTTQETKKET